MRIAKKIAAIVYRPYIEKQISRTTFFEGNDIRLKIPPGVFHPKYFFSTGYLAEYIQNIDVKNACMLELGAGSGYISISCARRGAEVYASDISSKVVAALEENSRANNVSLHIIESDLFDMMPPLFFDLIAINPPYYPRDAHTDEERAWFCGSNFEYFQKLFKQLNGYIKKTSRVLMILSEDCNLEAIFSIAQKNHFTFNEVSRKKILWEWNYIFEIYYDAA